LCFNDRFNRSNDLIKIDKKCITLVGYKSLPQGSVLSPFKYNIIGSCADRFIPTGCGFRQNADDLVVYKYRLVQTYWTSLNIFFYGRMGLTISAAKLEIMLFTSRKHEHPLVLVKIGCATSDDMFQIFGYIFRCWVAMELPCEICIAKMPPKSNLVEIGGRCFLGSASICLILLYEGLIGSVLEFGSVCFTNMAKTHIMGLERVQSRALRVVLALLGSTPNNCIGVLSGIPPMA
jgi:hypothetical protein